MNRRQPAPLYSISEYALSCLAGNGTDGTDSCLAPICSCYHCDRDRGTCDAVSEGGNGCAHHANPGNQQPRGEQRHQWNNGIEKRISPEQADDCNAAAQYRADVVKPRGKHQQYKDALLSGILRAIKGSQDSLPGDCGNDCGCEADTESKRSALDEQSSKSGERRVPPPRQGSLYGIAHSGDDRLANDNKICHCGKFSQHGGSQIVIDHKSWNANGQAGEHGLYAHGKCEQGKPCKSLPVKMRQPPFGMRRFQIHELYCPPKVDSEKQ